MKIQKKHLFHGAALTQIIEHGSFTAVNKASEKSGHYQINFHSRMLIKYRKQNGDDFRFSLEVDDIEILQNDFKSGQKCFLCLVCGEKTICLLNDSELKQLINFEKNLTQWLLVEQPHGKSIRVRSKNEELDRKVSHNSFPDKLFTGIGE